MDIYCERWQFEPRQNDFKVTYGHVPTLQFLRQILGVYFLLKSFILILMQVICCDTSKKRKAFCCFYFCTHVCIGIGMNGAIFLLNIEVAINSDSC